MLRRCSTRAGGRIFLPGDQVLRWKRRSDNGPDADCARGVKRIDSVRAGPQLQCAGIEMGKRIEKRGDDVHELSPSDSSEPGLDLAWRREVVKTSVGRRSPWLLPAGNRGKRISESARTLSPRWNTRKVEIGVEIVGANKTG
jgi:hypothetical protein